MEKTGRWKSLARKVFKLFLTSDFQQNFLDAGEKHDNNVIEAA
jgi:hypothetical protein